ncbi:MAG: Amidohydrolase [candidate division TA06 bacterium ADurb.Bin417]|uniref:Amidohydrolase n=1 Tax=candidate division TA06 bacterium ADurb.Bin417 TaxID=1852828 RepID=A0A1V5MGF4_UNCT6|nr:MAG: Amidohydrolase [candidate division TA06 bacterium ADurb.Bin417]
MPILLGHSFHRAWDEAVKIAREFDNIYLELTAVPDERGALELFVGELGSERVIYGTDFPWFSHHYYIGAVLGAGLGEGDCRNIFYRNARRLLDSFQAGRRPGRGQKKTRGKNEDPG